MGVQRRKREAREARASGSGVSARADIEEEYRERADAPLRKREFTAKAFNVMWISFFKLFAALAAAASIFVAGRSLWKANYGIAIFHAVSLTVFLSGRAWLDGVDVIMEDPEGLFGRFTPPLKLFLGTVLAQCSVLPLLVITGHPPDQWLKCFPSGLVFFAVALGVVTYMRWNLKKTVEYRKDLSKKLFGHN
jgi:hypothetical protein